MIYVVFALIVAAALFYLVLSESRTSRGSEPTDSAELLRGKSARLQGNLHRALAAPATNPTDPGTPQENQP